MLECRGPVRAATAGKFETLACVALKVADRGSHGHAQGYDSVTALGGEGRATKNDEYVLYSAQAKPTYIVEFIRRRAPPDGWLSNRVLCPARLARSGHDTIDLD